MSKQIGRKHSASPVLQTLSGSSVAVCFSCYSGHRGNCLISNGHVQVIKTYSVPKIALRDSTDFIVVAERSLGKRWIESGYYGSAATGLLSKSSSA